MDVLYRTICGSQWIPALNCEEETIVCKKIKPASILDSVVDWLLLELSLGSIGYRKWFCALSGSCWGRLAAMIAFDKDVSDS